jgi:glycosyltransferase involved in cell wall biosynthesis
LTGDDSRERSTAELITLAKKYRVADLLTFRPRYADIRPVLAALDVGLITSVRSEAVCRIALEYMSFAKPVVSSDVNILPEVVVNGRNGWTFRYDNPAELAACLSEAVLRKDLRSQRGATGAQMVRTEFSMETACQQTLDFYSRVIEAT